MRLGTKPFESSNPEDQLAWLVLRVIAALSPCPKASLIAYVAAGDSKSIIGQTTLTPHRRELIGDALLKLKGFAFVRFTQEQIAITDEGRRFLSELELVASRRDGRLVKTAEINRAMQAPPPGMRYIDLSRECATNLLARYIPRIKGFCQDRLAGAGHGFLMIRVRARNIALEVWKGKVAPTVRPRAPTVVLILTRFARVCCKSAQATANSLVNWPTQSGAALWKKGKVSWSSLNNKLAGLSRLAIVVGVLLVALSAVGSVALLSGNRAESKPEAPTVSLREPPIVWFYDGQDHPQQSIFVKRNFSGATWIEGISIRGENKSNQSLTAVQATLISDSGEQIELTVRATGGQQAQADAPNVPSGSEFSLEYSFHSDASNLTGMPAEEFLSKYGGMIFRLRYTVPGAQRTLLEYFSPSRLKAQLADASAQRREFD